MAFSSKRNIFAINMNTEHVCQLMLCHANFLIQKYRFCLKFVVATETLSLSLLISSIYFFFSKFMGMHDISYQNGRYKQTNRQTLFQFISCEILFSFTLEIPRICIFNEISFQHLCFILWRIMFRFYFFFFCLYDTLSGKHQFYQVFNFRGSI